MQLAYQHVVVLGGSSGIGLATARHVTTLGARSTIVSRSRERVDAALGTLPGSADGYHADLGVEAEVERLFGEIGAFDHLLYCAGENLTLAPLAETDLDQARGFLDTRLWGALGAVKHAAPLIREGGSITLMSGTASARPQPGWALAAAICGAIEGITRTLALELAPTRVNAVAPGIIRTDLWGSLSEADRAAMYEQTAGSLPVGRIGEPEDVAEAIAFLMANRHTTGSVLDVSGGGLLV